MPLGKVLSGPNLILASFIKPVRSSDPAQRINKFFKNDGGQTLGPVGL